MTTSQTPVATPPVAAAGTNSRRDDPSSPTENTGSGPCLVREGTAVASGEGEAPHATAVPTLKPCGTYAAARRHERRREPLCDPCLDARRAWGRERNRIVYSIPTLREREIARSAAYLARRRVTDPAWRRRVDAARLARRRAERQASLAVVDRVVVDRLIAGEPTVRASRGERAEAARVLHDRGWTRSLVAQQLAMSGSRVADILDGRPVRSQKHTPSDNIDAQEATA